MKRNPLVFVFDIEAAIVGIIEATSGKTFDEFTSDWLMRHGVQRGIEIISEATRHLPPEVLARHSESPGRKFVRSAMSCVTNIKASRTRSSGVWSTTTCRACKP